MTKRELANWLERQMDKTIVEMEKEIRQQRDAALDAELRPLGFYEMARQIENHIKQAWDIWIQWKMTHESSTLSASRHNYCGFEYNLKPLAHIDGSLAEHMVKYDITLDSTMLQELNKEEKKTRGKIRETYSSVINAVYASKNAKEAKTYVESLGFDLSEMENPPVPAKGTAEIDTSYLFLKQAA